MSLTNLDYTLLIPSLVGSLITIIFIIINGRYESNKRQKTILKAFKRELNDNIMILNQNTKLLNGEIKLIDTTEKEGIIAPIIPFKKEIGYLLNLNLPNNLIYDDMITVITHYFYWIDFLNEKNNLRELFKNTKRGLRDIRPELKNRDLDLIDEYKKFILIIEALRSSGKFD